MYLNNSHPVTYATISLFIFFALTIMMTGCNLGNDNGNGIELTGNSESYQLQSAGNSGISGVATFEEFEDGATLVTLQLSGTQAGGNHPAHIHNNTVAEGGGIAIPLNNADGSTGISETIISPAGGGISYSELIQFDGHVNVHVSEGDGTVVAEGDIGGNTLTGTSVTYELHEANASGISGEVVFEERNNGNTLATIELTGTPAQGDHPAHIHDNSVAEGGGVAVPFNNVDGNTGTSITNIRADDTAENLTYSALLEFNGHVNVHISDEDLTVVAQGDVGANYNQ